MQIKNRSIIGIVFILILFLGCQKTNTIYSTNIPLNIEQLDGYEYTIRDGAYKREYFFGSAIYGEWVAGPAMDEKFAHETQFPYYATIGGEFVNAVYGNIFNTSKIKTDIGCEIEKKTEMLFGPDVYSVDVPANSLCRLLVRPVYYHIKIVETKYKNASTDAILSTKTMFIDMFITCDYTAEIYN